VQHPRHYLQQIATRQFAFQPMPQTDFLKAIENGHSIIFVPDNMKFMDGLIELIHTKYPQHGMAVLHGPTSSVALRKWQRICVDHLNGVLIVTHANNHGWHTFADRMIVIVSDLNTPFEPGQRIRGKVVSPSVYHQREIHDI